MSTPNPYEVFISELRAVRLARKLSQGELAQRIKLSRAQYTAIENGRLYQQLKAQADEVERMRQSNENILESLDNGKPLTVARDIIHLTEILPASGKTRGYRVNSAWSTFNGHINAPDYTPRRSYVTHRVVQSTGGASWTQLTKLCPYGKMIPTIPNPTFQCLAPGYPQDVTDIYDPDLPGWQAAYGVWNFQQANYGYDYTFQVVSQAQTIETWTARPPGSGWHVPTGS